MFKVGDVIREIPSESNEFKPEVIRGKVIGNIEDENKILIEIIEHVNSRNIGVVFEIKNNDKYIELIDDSIKIKDIELLMTNFDDKEVENQENRIRAIQRDKEVARKRLVDLIKRLEEELIELEKIKLGNSSKEKIVNKIYEEIQSIQEDEKCERVEILQNELIIYTKQLYIEDEKYNKGHFKINKYKISINFSNFEVKVHGVLDNYNRKSCWSSKCPHPHISHTGNPCWGNTEAMLVDSIENKEIYTTFMIIVNFLETFNINDYAGGFIKNWDYVSREDDNKILLNPYSESNRNLNCGCTVTQNDEVYHCDICEETMCEDCCRTCSDCDATVCATHSEHRDSDGSIICSECSNK